MDNAIMGELLVPDDELPPDWRAALTLIARRTRDSLARHPWTLEASSEAQIGPNGLRHMEQSVASVAELGLDLAASFEIISLVDDYVFGHAQRRRLPGPQDPERRERWLADAFDYIDAEVARGDFPRLRELLGEGGIRPVWEDLRTADDEDERFERGLSRLLDGIALDLERGGPKASAKPRRSRRAGGSPPSTRSSTRRRT
jgi:hypothetical protein